MDQKDYSALGEQAAAAVTTGGTARRGHGTRRTRAALSALRRLAPTDDERDRWLRDNWYLAEREGAAALHALVCAKRQRRAGERTVAQRCCAAFLEACGGEITAPALEAWLTGFQRRLPLQRAEYAVLLDALKGAIVEALAQPDAPVSKLFPSLRTLSSLDLEPLLERTDPLDKVLRRDPAGVYAKMDRASRAYYRETLARLARRKHVSETDCAAALLQRSNQMPGGRRHIGFALRAAQTRVPEGRAYAAGIALVTGLLAMLIGVLTGSCAAAVLLLLPFSELVRQIADALLARRTRTRFVPRLELAHGVPKAGKTLCVIAALLTKPADGAVFAARLEAFRLCSRDAGAHLSFGLLADLPEAGTEEAAGDDAIYRAAADAIGELNARYGGGFYLFARPRAYVPSDGVWRPWERKRGALLSLAGALRGRKTDLRCVCGEWEALKDTVFLLTLDADTALTPGAAREMIAAMLHPLNRPQIDRARGVVTAGYGLLHPRIATDLEAATGTDFARVFAGPGGTDAYGGAAGELMMDRFDCGGFAGKGILDIDALLACCADLPENRVLSHDALEGAFLRGGYLSETELTDGFPASPRSFWARLERWTRGDWQNLPWLFRRGAALRFCDRLRLFDCLRRSLVPPSTFLAVAAGLLLPDPGWRVAAGAAVAGFLGALIPALARGLLQKPGHRAKHYGAVIHGFALALTLSLLRLLFLPQEAFLLLAAIVRALRHTITRRHCLQWQTAAQTEAEKRGTVLGYCRSMPASWIAGLALAILSPSAAGKATGLLWALSPLCAAALAREKPPSAAPDARERAYLLEKAEEIWRYFAELCTAEDHFLPPDNWQAHPPAGAAHRTSPTNLGLGLLACLCARALEIDGGEGLPLAERMLETLEALPRWRGHFYNWYHTITRKPLQPEYVSTVDSGNLAAALTAAAGAFWEFGRADLAGRVQKLLAPMDFKVLYDESRRLFRIGIDTRRGEPSPGWYDLMSSEARLTGYLAIARGDADKRHWRALSRAQVALDGYRGMASWTGTMFEYLMPELFLPLAPESLLWESAKFCLFAQKKRVPRHIPWGVSESAYYALDQSLHYRYKAHGVGALALSRGMDRELVISPYSTYLALLVEPRAALRNLRRLDRPEWRGRYGLWEAIDFTPSRGDARHGAVVKSVMAHHLGMSLAAITNRLLNGQVQRWTMADSAMRAHRSMLQERVPLSGGVLHRRRETPARTKKAAPAVNERRSGAGTDARMSASWLLTNGALHLLFDETGALLPEWEGAALFAEPPRLRLRGTGISFPLTGGTAAEWTFRPDRCAVRAEADGLSAALTAAVAETETAFLVSVTLTAERQTDCALEWTITPALARRADYDSHPAFWRLGLQEKRRGGAVLFRRLARGDTPERWMAFACGRTDEGPDGSRWLRDGQSRIGQPLRLQPGRTVTIRFAFGVGAYEDTAFLAAQQALAMPERAFSGLNAKLAASLGADGMLADAMALLAPLRSGTLCAAETDPGLRRRGALWALGISGDLPILAAALKTDAEKLHARRLVRMHALLTGCGFAFDLVFFADDGGDYRRPAADFLHDALAEIARADAFGARGGVHLTQAETPVCAAAALIAKGGALMLPPRSTLPLTAAYGDRRDRNLRPVETRRIGGSGMVFHAAKTLPRRAWTLPLTNGRFGCTAADSGCGDMWLKNARENRITPWRNDPWAIRGAEWLSCEDGAALFADGENDAAVTFRFGCAEWRTRSGRHQTRVTVFVPADVDARVMMIEQSENTRLRWRLDLLCAGEARDAGFLETAESDGVFTAQNPRAEAPFTVRALCSAPAERFTMSRLSAERAQLDGFAGTGMPGCFCAEFAASGRMVLIVGTADEAALRPLLDWGAASRALADTQRRWARFAAGLQAHTPEDGLTQLLSGWAAYQTLACRLLARSTIYQSGGAIGFRDQLQDAVNLLLLGREPARGQILLCCAHQFPEGDVCHWWHPDAGRERGVRTRISDDLLWLPWALAEYAEKTGDLAVCAERISWLVSAPLETGERERYGPIVPARETASVLEHAVRAVQCALRRGTGDHGLLRIGAGDWNDGMDRVGGESVWLSFFFSHTAHRLAALLDRVGVAGGEAMRHAAETIGNAAERAWDGAWYRRGYFADGTPLGSADGGACQIDSISQSWSVLCPETTAAHRAAALQSALDRLYDPETRLVKLLDPPFLSGTPDPGYLRSYGPGFRENGGQYTHAAVWLAMALLRTGRTAEGWEILRAATPCGRDPDVYEAEPFVIAADVCTGEHAGTAGWTWYTGAAGWFLRTAAEDGFGLRARDGQVSIEQPHLPPEWKRAALRWRDADGLTHKIVYDGAGIAVDGAPYDGKAIGRI